MALDALQVFQTRTVVEFIKNNYLRQDTMSVQAPYFHREVKLTYLIGWVFLCEEAGNVRRDESGAAGEKN